MSFTNDFNFNVGMFGYTKPKGNIRDMFDENGEPIVYDRYGNPVREEVPATVGQVEEVNEQFLESKVKTRTTEATKKKEDWSINMPTSNETLINRKEFNYEVLISLLLESKWNGDMKETHRYIYKNNINFMELSKKAGISVNTFKKAFNNLIKLGFIIDTTFNDERVYKIPQKYTDGNILFDVRFLDDLLKLLHKNLIRIYIQYYKYCYKNNNTGIYKMPQAKTLEAVGLSVNGKNKDYLKKVNRLLEKVGLIEITEVKHHSGTPQEIRCPYYKESTFYKEILNKKG
ncbi:hypothetical protein [Clostridium saudiense]|uniref:hypothetical protein n=1 Tax=Clostridium saudiense TaxID=1414720 RepID=UPI002595536E|nr:hypothetical protein [Clostridium saudiense]MDU3521595.1 hypothetical protein [Clostridium saudiense]